jgi:hypothetical protein
VCGISPCIKPGAGGRVCPRRRGLVLKERRAATSARACPQLRARRASHAAGPVVSVGRPSARRGPGLEIQGPQCAFETSMFMCPAVHMSTRNLLRSSSTHEPSDPPFRVVSLFAEWHNHRTGPTLLSTCSAAGAPSPGRSHRDAAREAQGLSASFKGFSHRSSSGAKAPVTPRGSGGSQPSLNR